MSARVTSYVHPAEPPVVELGGGAADIPLVRFVDGMGCDLLTISLGNHPTPAQWLRETADRFAALADVVDARARREYRAKVARVRSRASAACGVSTDG